MLHKSIVAIALFLSIGINNSFAAANNDAGKNRRQKTQMEISLARDFANAELLTRVDTRDYTKLTIKMNEVVLFAFYTPGGSLLAVTRNIRSNQLPIQLLLDLKKNYGAYWISDLFEFTTDEQNSYYVTLENADMKITLKSTGSNKWEKFASTVKE